MKKLALLCSGAVVAGSLVAVSAPADAATGTAYTCNNLTGASASNSVVAPASTQVGQAVPVQLTSTLTVPGGVIAGLLDGAQLKGSGTGGAAGSITGPDGTHPINAVTGKLSGITALGSNTLPLTGATNFIPAQPGTYTITAGPDSATLDTLLALVPGTLQLACVPAVDQVLGTITVQPATGTPPPVPGVNDSTTTLALTRTSEAYGQANTATATVTTGALGQLAQNGNVTFTVGGRSPVTVPVSSGVARLRLPKLPAGQTYAVKADYVPGNPVIAASSAQTTVKVVKDGTRTRVGAPNIRRHRAETATVRVVSVHGTLVRGKVRAVLKRGRHVLRTRTVRLTNGVAHVRFGRIAKRGRTYSVVARYLGNPDFKRSRGKDGFVVR
jgi:hypothetical protein